MEKGHVWRWSIPHHPQWPASLALFWTLFQPDRWKKHWDRSPEWQIIRKWVCEETAWCCDKSSSFKALYICAPRFVEFLLMLVFEHRLPHPTPTPHVKHGFPMQVANILQHQKSHCCSQSQGNRSFYERMTGHSQQSHQICQNPMCHSDLWVVEGTRSSHCLLPAPVDAQNTRRPDGSESLPCLAPRGYVVMNIKKCIFFWWNKIYVQWMQVK